MKKLLLIIGVLLFQCCTMEAQLKINLASGLASQLKNTDSLFFTKKQGGFANLNAAYYWGRLGIGLKVSKNKIKAIDNIAAARPPVIDSFRNPNGAKGNGVNTTQFLIGPEICLCYKRIKIMPTIKVGIVNSKADSTKLNLESFNGVNRFYSSATNKANSFGLNGGLIVAFKLSSHFGISLNADYLTFNINSILRDSRDRANTTKIIQQKKQFINLGLGLYTNF